MKTIDIDSIQPFELPGVVHRTIASPATGAKTFEAWMQTVAPGAQTPPHKHDCEEIVVMLSGTVTCRNERGEECVVGPNQSIVFEPNVTHEIINTGDVPATGMAFFAMKDLVVQDPTGEHMPLPWQQ